MIKHSRSKKFLVLIILVFVSASFFFSSCGTSIIFKKNFEDKIETKTGDVKLDKTEFLLGTIVSIQLYGNADEEILNGGFSLLKDIENKMSTSIETSDVSKINNSEVSSKTTVSYETAEVILASQKLSKETSGYFNINIGEIVNLWGIGTPNSKIPRNDELQLALDRIRAGELVVENNEVSREKSDFKIDLGAIAKGYAADKLAKYLKENGVNSAIINLGGNVLAIGKKINGEKFKVGIQNPHKNRNQYLAIVEVEDFSVVTSGNYERFFEEDGKRYHHIFDVNTGYPVDSNISSVTVLSKESLLADGLSTALYAMGIRKGLDLVNSLPEVDCMYVTNDKKIYFSKDASKLFTITDNDYEIMN